MSFLVEHPSSSSERKTDAGTANASQAKPTRPEETTVVIAMSGGLDSSMAAALLVEQGYRCIGVMMRLWAEVSDGEGSSNKCCSLESVDDARRVADQLDIPFYLINVEEPFRENVVEFYLDGYRKGVTPNPCLACNRHIRFDYLLNYARRLGADYLATGHHARVERNERGTVTLRRAQDRGKDQSYVLSVLGQSELQDVLFPVGDYLKPDLRRMAEERGLPIAAKHDSMDLCFVADDDYRRFLRDWAPESMQDGPILNRDGEQLGHHRGLAGYTIGQRKGLGLGGAGEALYVIEMDPDRNALIVGTAEELGVRRMIVDGVGWTEGEAMVEQLAVACQIRYRAAAVPATITSLSPKRVEVLFEQPQKGVSPGQAAVFYRDDVCLGGGTISQSTDNDPN